MQGYALQINPTRAVTGKHAASHCQCVLGLPVLLRQKEEGGTAVSHGTCRCGRRPRCGASVITPRPRLVRRDRAACAGHKGQPAPAASGRQR